MSAFSIGRQTAFKFIALNESLLHVTWITFDRTELNSPIEQYPKHHIWSHGTLQGPGTRKNIQYLIYDNQKSQKYT